jgi:hypothetical protein
MMRKNKQQPEIPANTGIWKDINYFFADLLFIRMDNFPIKSNF